MPPGNLVPGWLQLYGKALLALQLGLPNEFKRYLSRLSTTRILDKHHENLLHHCVRMARPDGLLLLLSWPGKRPPVNGRNVKGETALHVALRLLASGDPRIRELKKIIILLISSGADIFQKDARGCAALHLVPKVAHCCPNLVRKFYNLLLQFRPKLDLPTILLEHGWTITMSFLLHCVEISLRMIELDPRIMYPRNGQRPNELLHYALQAGSPIELIEVFVRYYGLDVNSYINGQWPLHVAAMANVGSSHYDHISLLLSLGANPNLYDKHSLRPIHYIIKNGNTAIFELLMAAGSVSPRSDMPLALHYAADRGCINMMWYLMPMYDVNSRCSGKMTPLHYAARKRSAAAVYYLLAFGASVNAEDAQGWTPLHHAIYSGAKHSRADLVPVIGLLLHFGANVHHLSNDKISPLFAAFMLNHSRAVYMLIRHIALHKDDNSNIFETLIEKEDDLFELYKKCLQELMRLSECGIPENANYLQLLQFSRQELIEVARGIKKVNYLQNTPEGGVKFVSSQFSSAAFPIYGNYLMSRVHHANIELMAFEETVHADNHFKSAILAESANEFVDFFSEEYLL